MATMKALKLFRKKSEIRLVDFPAPQTPDAENVIIKVAYCGVCGTDIHIKAQTFPSAEEVILGHEFSGVITAVGEKVQDLAVGDRVVVNPNSYCGRCRFCARGKINYCITGGLRSTFGIYRNGGWAEYCEVPEVNAEKLPESLSLRQAVICEPLACIVHGWRNNGLVPADAKILVMGTGIIGLLWSCMFHYHGYRDVTITEILEGRRKLANNLGFGFAVYHPDELRPKMEALDTEVDGFDLIVDCTGNPEAIQDAFPWIRRGGRLNVFGCCPKNSQMTIDPSMFMMKEVTMSGTLINPFTSHESVALVSNMADRYFDFQKMGIQEFRMEDHEKALETLKGGSISKAVFKIGGDLK